MWESRWHHQASGAEPGCATRSGPNKRMLNRTHRITAVILCCTIVVLPAIEYALTNKPPSADTWARTMSDAEAGSVEMLVSGSFLAPQSDAARNLQASRPIHVDACALGGGNGSEAKPYDTLTRAVKAASSGDTIIIHPGLYQERLIIDDKRLTLTATGGPAIMDGTEVSASQESDHITAEDAHIVIYREEIDRENGGCQYLKERVESESNRNKV